MSGESEDPSPLRILLVGDVMLGRLVNKMLKEQPVREFQARCARYGEQRAIAARMQRLCARLDPATRWDEQAGRLEIRVE